MSVEVKTEVGSLRLFLGTGAEHRSVDPRRLARHAVASRETRPFWGSRVYLHEDRVRIEVGAVLELGSPCPSRARCMSVTDLHGFRPKAEKAPTARLLTRLPRSTDSSCMRIDPVLSEIMRQSAGPVIATDAHDHGVDPVWDDGSAANTTVRATLDHPVTPDTTNTHH